MATKLLVCPECESAVRPGRLTCASCGTLLASVANGPRALGWTEPAVPPALMLPSVVDELAGSHPVEPELTAPTDPGARIGPAWAHGPLERAPGETDEDLAADDTLAVHDTVASETESSGTIEPALDTEAAFEADREPEAWPDGEPEPETSPEVHTNREPRSRPAPAAEVVSFASPEPAPVTETRWPESRRWPPPDAAPPPVQREPDLRPRAGAYLPPSADPMDDDTIGATPPQPAVVPAAAAAAPARPDPAPASASEPAAAPAPRLPGLDPMIPPRVVATGAAIAGLGFLLPWAAVVIGSGRIGGFLEQWGLAGPGHSALLLGLVALGVAASQADRLPAWARPGVPAVILGGLLVGLVWPYLFGSLQPMLGVFLTVLGAIVLVAGGILDLRSARHAEDTRPV